MSRLGSLLRTCREELGLSLRDVGDRTAVLAKRWGSKRYMASYSQLGKLELGLHDIRVSTLISVSRILSREPHALLDACMPAEYYTSEIDSLDYPNATALITQGRLLEVSGRLIASRDLQSAIPRNTGLLPPTPGRDPHRYKRAIVGLKDRTLYPLLRPGSIVIVDTHQRAIASPRDWTNEFDRPIYLLHTREGFICGWCQMTKNDSCLNIVSHLMSKLDVLPLLYGKEVEVIGRVVHVATPLE